ncbi:hypothetical protein, conserved [Leishmania tarentolae]|uniref:BAR domain-containing protein n=1 Tax=Leishmania tarentolae TaxID=5689 RepID=A0A640KLC8_LEITA|nr:hypothetical protein, conserved [Leishmania tarentolae]
MYPLRIHLPPSVLLCIGTACTTASLFSPSFPFWGLRCCSSTSQEKRKRRIPKSLPTTAPSPSASPCVCLSSHTLPSVSSPSSWRVPHPSTLPPPHPTHTDTHAAAMPLCASIPETVDTDTSARALYLDDLDKCMKNFSSSLTSTMNSYRNLLSAFDQVAQVYGNVSQECGEEARKTVGEFRDGMRDLKDRGGFDTFNQEIHVGTIRVMEPVNTNLKKALKSLKNLRAKQKEYDTVRYELEQTEKSYAKKNKPLKDSSSYKKTLAKRDKAKVSYEASRDAFGKEVDALQATTKSVLLQSLNNYLHCTAAFCGHLEATMDGYRTDVDHNGSTTFSNNQMDKLREKAKAESTARRSKRKNEASTMCLSTNNIASNSNRNVPSVDDGLYPKKYSLVGSQNDGHYPNAETAPSMPSDANELEMREPYDSEAPSDVNATNPLVDTNEQE